MKKKYKVLLIIAAVLVVVDLVGFFVFASPAMKMNKLFKALDDGDSKTAQSTYRELSANRQTKATNLLIDFAYDKENKLESDKITYKEFSKCMEAATSMTKKTPVEVSSFKAKGDRFQMKSLFEDCAHEYTNNKQSDEYIKLKDSFLDIYDSYTYDTEFDNEMIEYLDQKNEDFKKNVITADELNAYAYTGADLFSVNSSAYEKATRIANDLQNIQMYETHYQEAQGYFDDNDYYKCYDYCVDEIGYYFSYDNDTTGYSQKFEKLRDDAYEKGKTYYLEQANAAIENGNKEEAKEILSKIDEFYDGAVDTASTWESAREPWMTPYIECLTDINDRLEQEVATAPKTGNYNDPSTFDVKYVILNYFSLYDFDDNGVPELIVSDKKSGLNFIYTYVDEKVVLTGVLSIYGFCKKPYIAIYPRSYPEYWSGRSIVEFNGKEWKETESFCHNSATDDCKVNGQTVTYDELSAESNRISNSTIGVNLQEEPLDGDISRWIYNYKTNN